MGSRNNSGGSPMAARPLRWALLVLAPLLASSTVLTVHDASGRAIHLGAISTRGTPDAPSGELRLVAAGFGCDAEANRERAEVVSARNHGPFALFARRGACSFDTKMRTAINAGASALVVSDSLTGEYQPASNATAATMALQDPCIAHCGHGKGDVDPTSLTVSDVLAGLPGTCGDSCPTELCAFSGAKASDGRAGGRQVCCALATQSGFEMALPETIQAGTALAALYLSIPSGVKLDQLCFSAHAAECTAEIGANGRGWDLSALAIWLLGSCTAAAAAYIAATDQHTDDTEQVREHGSISRQSEESTLDVRTALSFLVIASTFLLLLYFMLQAGFSFVLLLLVLLFVLASTTSLTAVLTYPLLQKFAGRSLEGKTMRLPNCPFLYEGDEVLLLDFAAFASALSVGVLWFLMRRSPWAWLLQDGLSVCVCMTFMRALRLPSLRVAALFLGLMFFYDIFMVFISPSLFHTSIMMAVATAGEPTAAAAADGTCERTEGERMPMLMSVPRLSNPSTTLDGHERSFWYMLSGADQNFAMLGLGDIVIPGLALTLARRLDLALAARHTAGALPGASSTTSPRLGSAPSASPRGCAASEGCSYFKLAAGGYALGLALTLAANTYGLTFNDVQGQPALLYLVPCVIGAFFLRAVPRHELAAVWHGTPLLGTAAGPGEEADGNGCCCDYKRL